MWTLLRRIRAAVAILFLPGDRMPVTRHELQTFRHEWAEWQALFTGSLEKLNAWYARQAKREKRELERQAGGSGTSADDPPPTTSRRDRKIQLYRRAGGMGASLPHPSAVTPPGEDDE